MTLYPRLSDNPSTRRPVFDAPRTPGPVSTARGLAYRAKLVEPYDAIRIRRAKLAQATGGVQGYTLFRPKLREQTSS